MLIQKEKTTCEISIKAYSPGNINISGQNYQSPVLVSPGLLTLFQPISEFALLKTEHLLSIIPKETEILLIGSGAQHRFLPTQEISPLLKQGIGVEVMATRQACHTFQILALEDRKIIALLFP